jgi:hypothetical protein
MTQMTGAEKRKNLRIPSSRPVVFIINNQNLYATMTDFSKHGIGFISNFSAKENDRVEVHFDIPISYSGKAIKAFQFKAEVRHCLNLTGKNHIGVRLDFPTKDYLQIFDELTVA